MVLLLQTLHLPMENLLLV